MYQKIYEYGNVLSPMQASLGVINPSKSVNDRRVLME